MNHPLSGLNSQLGAHHSALQRHTAAKHSKHSKQKKYRPRYGFAFGEGEDFGEGDFSSTSIINDFAGIGGEDDEALQGFGDGDEYLGFSLKAGLKKVGHGFKNVGKGIAHGARAVVMAPVKAVKAIDHKIHHKPTRSQLEDAAKKKVQQAAVARASGILAPAQTARIDTSLPKASPVAQLDTAIPRPADTTAIDSSIPQLVSPVTSSSTVVSNGGALTAAQVTGSKPVASKKSFPIAAHPLLAYSGQFQGFEGFFDDIKNKLVGDAKAAATKAVTTAKTNLITNVTKTITGNDVVQKAASDVAKQNAAEAAIAKTEAAAKQLVAKTEQAAQYVQANAGKVAGISTVALAAAGLGAYFLFFRKKSA